MTFRPLLDRDEYHARLQLIFPREAWDTVLANPLAAAAIAVMIWAHLSRLCRSLSRREAFWEERQVG